MQANSDGDYSGGQLLLSSSLCFDHLTHFLSLLVVSYLFFSECISFIAAVAPQPSMFYICNLASKRVAPKEKGILFT